VALNNSTPLARLYSASGTSAAESPVVEPVSSAAPVEALGASSSAGWAHPAIVPITIASDNRPAHHFPVNNFIGLNTFFELE